MCDPLTADQLAPQIDDLRQIQGPFHLAMRSADAVKRVSRPHPMWTTTASGCRARKILGDAVKSPALQDHTRPGWNLRSEAASAQGLLIQLADQRLGSLVFDKGIGRCDSMVGCREV